MKHATYTIYKKESLDISSIKVENRNSNIGKVLEMIKAEDIVLPMSDKYYSWNNNKKEQFIESIILGLPIPSFFFYTDEDSGKLLIIDGVQRLHTLYDFIVKRTISLHYLSLLDEYKYNKSFDELPYSTRLNIKIQSVTLNIISGINSPEAKYEIFKRYNNTSHHLTPAEIRYNLFPGNANHIIEEMCRNELFIKLIGNKINNNKREAEDYVSRFITLYLDNNIIQNENFETLITYTYDTLNKDFNSEDTLQLIQTFDRSLSICYQIFGEKAFLIPSIDNRSNTVSLKVFEMLSVAIALLTETEQYLIVNKEDIFSNKYLALYKDKHFMKLLSSEDNYQKIRSCINTIDNLIKSILKG